ncbi:hypothetical protein VQ071_19005 [Cohnella sp. 56]|uniref:hypothetical protein n=1 Tax=Cohnella sp. 56 TaxID=3113722 RepID=UPI0030E91B75
MAPFGSDEIFSDDDSRAGRYKRLSEMWAVLALALFPVLVALISTDMIDPSVWLNPKTLYYTQGLWEMHGAAFWKAFLFETPFALFRGGIWAILPATIVIYMYCAWKANQQYTLAQKNKIIH